MNYRQRKQTKIKNFSYTADGIYFITLCAKDRQRLFGSIVNGEMLLSEAGKQIQETWMHISNLYTNISLDEFIIMPNHFHAILILLGAGAYKIEYQQNQGVFENEAYQELAPRICSLADIMRDFKSYTSHVYYLDTNHILWQRGYYEHIIRSDIELDHVRKYIKDNIINWEHDDYNNE